MIKNAHANDRRGFVLVTVLLLVVLLAGMLLEFNYESRMNLHVSDYRLQSTRALWCAEAGVNAALAAIRDGEVEAGPTIPDARNLRIADAGDCTVVVTLENGKLNANGLRMPEGGAADCSLDRRRIECLLRLVDVLNRRYSRSSPIGYGIVPAIVDWTDPDCDLTHLPFVERENEGAEDEYYQGLPHPHRCRNRPLDSVRELLLVRGITAEIFDSPPRASDDDQAVPGLSRLVTVYGDGKIDINHAPPLVVESLSELIDPGLAQSIVDHRPYASVGELATVPGMSMAVLNAIGSLITVRPAAGFYRIESVGRVGEFERRIAVIATKNCKTGSMTVLLREEP
ncbi:MAG TPA: hypothetical protein VM223_07930 [Planctomycetota bacterium]|nr:hypothetical protein [Planctomycetota bacterium]